MRTRNQTYNLANVTRAGFFALTVTLGGFLAIEQLSRNSLNNFVQVSIIMCLVFVIELYTSWQYYITPQLNAHERPHRRTLLIHHLLLPISTYLSIIIFTYFNRDSSLQFTTLSLGFILFTILFINIRAYYQYQGQVELHTNYIYDIVKLVLFFCLSDTLFNLIFNQIWTAFLLIPITTFGLGILLTMRYKKFEVDSTRFVLIITFIITLISAICVLILTLTPIQSALITFITFYICTAALHHYLHHDLKLNLIIEYVAIVIIAILLLYGVNLG